MKTKLEGIVQPIISKMYENADAGEGAGEDEEEDSDEKDEL